MGRNTAIEWTKGGHTWNPWIGCDKVSEGCKFCYMFREQKRYGRDPSIVVRTKPATFNSPLKWKEPAFVFTCSWSDWFHKDADEWRDDAWDIIRQTPHLTYQVLTKRADRIEDHLPDDWEFGWDNVWLGVSIETQKHIGRLDPLLEIPSKVRFVSAEPLLGPINFENYLAALGYDMSNPPLHWIIAGGESGPGCREMKETWARDIRDQCQRSNIAYFLKQLGGHPNKRAGEDALLDGQRYLEMPV